MQTLGVYLLRGLAPSLAFGCCQQQPYLPVLQHATLSSRFFSLSRSMLLRLFSYARVLLVLAPTEAGGIRSTAPPNKEIGWDGCAK